MKYFLELSYDGGRYHGWQRRKNVETVQETFEFHLSRLLKKKTYVIGCGRTDTGVHASQYFAHIKVEHELHDQLLFRLNKSLPSDIAVHRIIEVPHALHAQHDAKSRTYVYYLHQSKNPFLSPYSTTFPLRLLNLKSIDEGIQFLRSISDFKSMCRNPKAYKTTVCNLLYLNQYSSKSGDQLKLTITSDRFLRSMVRLIVGRLLDLGLGKMGIDTFCNLVSSGARFPHFNPAPPQGLHLNSVTYDEFETRASTEPITFD